MEFFKQYSYYEEVVDAILKESSHNDPEIYEQLKNNPKKRENAIRNYHTAFYLMPKIRKKLPLRLKPMPQKMKDKFLRIPGKNATKYDVNGEKLLKGKHNEDNKGPDDVNSVMANDKDVDMGTSETNTNIIQPDKNPQEDEILAIDDERSKYGFISILFKDSSIYS